MIAIIIKKDERITYDNILCFELNLKNNEITLYKDVSPFDNIPLPEIKLNHTGTSVILKKDGVIVDWVWSEQQRLLHADMADKLKNAATVNGAMIDAVDYGRMLNPFPEMYEGRV